MVAATLQHLILPDPGRGPEARSCSSLEPPWEARLGHRRTERVSPASTATWSSECPPELQRRCALPTRIRRPPPAGQCGSRRRGWARGPWGAATRSAVSMRTMGRVPPSPAFGTASLGRSPARWRTFVSDPPRALRIHKFSDRLPTCSRDPQHLFGTRAGKWPSTARRSMRSGQATQRPPVADDAPWDEDSRDPAAQGGVDGRPRKLSSAHHSRKNPRPSP